MWRAGAGTEKWLAGNGSRTPPFAALRAGAKDGPPALSLNSGVKSRRGILSAMHIAKQGITWKSRPPAVILTARFEVVPGVLERLPFGPGRGFAGRLYNASIRGKKRRFGRETNVAQAGMAQITCRQCNAWYNTEGELREHMKTAHRQGASGQVRSERDDTQPDRSKIQPRDEQKMPDREGGSRPGGSGRGGSRQGG